MVPLGKKLLFVKGKMNTSTIIVFYGNSADVQLAINLNLAIFSSMMLPIKKHIKTKL